MLSRKIISILFVTFFVLLATARPSFALSSKQDDGGEPTVDENGNIIEYVDVPVYVDMYGNPINTDAPAVQQANSVDAAPQILQVISPASDTAALTEQIDNIAPEVVGTPVVLSASDVDATPIHQVDNVASGIVGSPVVTEDASVTNAAPTVYQTGGPYTIADNVSTPAQQADSIISASIDTPTILDTSTVDPIPVQQVENITPTVVGTPVVLSASDVNANLTQQVDNIAPAVIGLPVVVEDASVADASPTVYQTGSPYIVAENVATSAQQVDSTSTAIADTPVIVENASTINAIPVVCQARYPPTVADNVATPTQQVNDIASAITNSPINVNSLDIATSATDVSVAIPVVDTSIGVVSDSPIVDTPDTSVITSSNPSILVNDSSVIYQTGDPYVVTTNIDTPIKLAADAISISNIQPVNLPDVAVPISAPVSAFQPVKSNQSTTSELETTKPVEATLYLDDNGNILPTNEIENYKQYQVNMNDSIIVYVDGQSGAIIPPPPQVIASTVTDPKLYKCPKNQFVSGSCCVSECPWGTYPSGNTCQTCDKNKCIEDSVALFSCANPQQNDAFSFSSGFRTYQCHNANLVGRYSGNNILSGVYYVTRPHQSVFISFNMAGLDIADNSDYNVLLTVDGQQILNAPIINGPAQNACGGSDSDYLSILNIEFNHTGKSFNLSLQTTIDSTISSYGICNFSITINSCPIGFYQANNISCTSVCPANTYGDKRTRSCLPCTPEKCGFPIITPPSSSEPIIDSISIQPIEVGLNITPIDIDFDFQQSVIGVVNVSQTLVKQSTNDIINETLGLGQCLNTITINSLPFVQVTGGFEILNSNNSPDIEILCLGNLGVQVTSYLNNLKQTIQVLGNFDELVITKVSNAYNLSFSALKQGVQTLNIVPLQDNGFALSTVNIVYSGKLDIFRKEETVYIYTECIEGSILKFASGSIDLVTPTNCDQDSHVVTNNVKYDAISTSTPTNVIQVDPQTFSSSLNNFGTLSMSNLGQMITKVPGLSLQVAHKRNIRRRGDKN